MKLSDYYKKKFRQVAGDPEVAHSLYDEVLANRLKELDPEFLKELEDATEDITFWYS